MPLSKVEGLEEFANYFVDVLGNIWSTKGKRLRKLLPGNSRKRGGYLFVRLTNCAGKKQNFYVHQLVARAFLPNFDKKYEVNHINRNSFDNSIKNLEWCNRAENMAHVANSKGAKLDSRVVEKAKQLHAQLSGENAINCDLHSFINAILEGELDRIKAEK